MFTDEHALDYSSPLIFDEYDDDFLEVEFDAENVYDDLFDSNGEKIKESKLLIDELDLPCDFLPLSEYDSFISQDFSRVDALPSTNNEDKVFNPGILIQEKPFEIITRVVQDKKLGTSNASLVLGDFDPPFYEPLFFIEVPKSNMLLPFLYENEEKVFKPGIHTSEKVYSSFIPKLSHQGYKIFKINQIFKSLMKIFLFSCGKDTHILAVPCLHFYPLDQFKYGGISIPGNLKTHAEGFCPPVFISSASLGNHPHWENDLRKLGAAPDSLREIGVVEGIDYGAAGEVKKVVIDRIHERQDNESIVILSNLGYSISRGVLNCNAYEVATACTLDLGAENLICIIDGPILDEWGHLIRFLTLEDADMLIRRRAQQSELTANYVKAIG
uniref:Probable amino-acid acetyltransferase NAGS1, chloroplastic isoform X1 n=1 Tax=Tanacetum cinerariifolium TaxID=118510 RepID=A0A6L2NAG0_TANCI|nr:probable amino-acid acetyltransferase NAGS1, chloroplastic isoform X1 [Tanacetum cinerariifolium]